MATQPIHAFPVTGYVSVTAHIHIRVVVVDIWRLSLDQFVYQSIGGPAAHKGTIVYIAQKPQIRVRMLVGTVPGGHLDIVAAQLRCVQDATHDQLAATVIQVGIEIGEIVYPERPRPPAG
jgi:hypothetical protein